MHHAAAFPFLPTGALSPPIADFRNPHAEISNQRFRWSVRDPWVLYLSF